ncbi:ABC transporter permease [Actinoplanes sp. NPDC051861]|uniref:ABC transporter permease n=1 Tax=Actinoplanes sp. NPDC051861 TaxID=3155170 RepID=UPI003420D946
MTTATATRSAYPRTVDELIPHARELAEQLGETPSRNKLMKTLHVGKDKANALLVALAPTPAAPASTTPEPVEAATAEPVIEPAPDPADFIAIDEEMARLLDPSLRPAKPVEPGAADPVVEPAPKRRRPIVWPVLILCLPAFVAIWGGWVEMGRLTGFGMVTLLPGISEFQLNTAITLPIGVETYAAYALYVWLSGMVAGTALKFAKWSALASLGLGALGQVAYHLMAAAGWDSAPWPITAAVSCIPVAVLGMGAGLAHLMHRSH